MSRRLRGVLFRAWCLTGFLAASARATAQGHTANLNGASLYYEDAGEGTPLVLVHGWSLNLRMWDPQVSAR